MPLGGRRPCIRGCSVSQNPSSVVARLLSLWILLISGTAHGQMVPLEDLRRNTVDAIYYDAEDWQDHHSPVPFAYWEDFCVGHAQEFEPCDPPMPPPDDLCLKGQTFGNAYQISQFFPAAIQFSVASSGSWDGVPAGLYSAGSYVGFKFRLDYPVDYDIFVGFDGGDNPTGGSVNLWAYYSTGSTFIYSLIHGLQESGRLGPGTYKLDGVSNSLGPAESMNGPTYSVQWTVHPPAQPHIAYQPSDHAAACGGTVVFSVSTTLPTSNYTFQWRRNFAPLTNGTGIAGATSPTLTLTNVCSADDYDVVVTGPDVLGGATVAEPSRLAHLSIVTPTGVETEPASPTVTVRAPAPNPFRVSTSVAYEAPVETRLVATVYNAAGARIRSLADRTVEGMGSVTWDGRLASGTRAAAGIYFLKVELGSVRQTRKVALLD